MILKQIPEDFVVKEVLGKEPLGRGNYVWFTVKKRNWDTLKLISVLAKRLNITRKKIGYAGLKDHKSVSYQTFSVLGVSIKAVEDVKIKDTEFSDFSYNTESVRLGDLEGNCFSIVARDIDKKDAEKAKNKIKTISKGILNIYDSQRFGGRNVTQFVGKGIIKSNFEEAVFIYLTKTYKGEPDEVRKARKRLTEEGDVKEALKYFPGFLNWEIAILNYLVEHPKDYTGAINILPKTLQLMFIHGYQSYIWNLTARECINKKLNPEDIALVGFNTRLGSSKVDKIIKSILSKEKIKLEDFRIRALPRLSCEGSSRKFLIFPKDLQSSWGEDELNKGKKKLVISFQLEKGAYATQVVKSLF